MKFFLCFFVFVWHIFVSNYRLLFGFFSCPFCKHWGFFFIMYANSSCWIFFSFFSSLESIQLFFLIYYNTLRTGFDVVNWMTRETKKKNHERKNWNLKKAAQSNKKEKIQRFCGISIWIMALKYVQYIIWSKWKKWAAGPTKLKNRTATMQC